MKEHADCEYLMIGDRVKSLPWDTNQNLIREGCGNVQTVNKYGPTESIVNIRGFVDIQGKLPHLSISAHFARNLSLISRKLKRRNVDTL